MERDSKVLLGKILGEIYRLQQRDNDFPCAADPSHIYGLLNGFEEAINHEIESIGAISSKKITAVMDVLDPIWSDKDKLEKFRGFYDIEEDLRVKGVDRSDAIKILTYLNARGQFTDVIKKMDSSNSPSECRTFEVSEWDR